VTRRALARLGFAATAVLYVVVGATAAQLALRGARDPAAGMPGALAWLLRQAHGRVATRAVAAGLASFALWHLLEARARRKGWLERIGHAIGAIGYLGLTATAVSLLARGPGAGVGFPEASFDGLFSRPIGIVLLRVAGLFSIGGGIYEIWQGVTGRLRQRFAVRGLAADAARFLRRTARFGLAARGVVLIVIGAIPLRVARGLEAARMASVGGALGALSGSAWGGPWLAGVVAVGLVAYGLYMGVLAIAVRRT
jgi:Domain of Unknown Function (DUF1206)